MYRETHALGAGDGEDVGFVNADVYRFSTHRTYTCDEPCPPVHVRVPSIRCPVHALSLRTCGRASPKRFQALSHPRVDKGMGRYWRRSENMQTVRKGKP